MAFSRCGAVNDRGVSDAAIDAGFPTSDDGSTFRSTLSSKRHLSTLVDLKRKYDPQNLFHVNQNVRP
jgi:hypothetical protein